MPAWLQTTWNLVNALVSCCLSHLMRSPSCPSSGWDLVCSSLNMLVILLKSPSPLAWTDVSTSWILRSVFSCATLICAIESCVSPIAFLSCWISLAVSFNFASTMAWTWPCKSFLISSILLVVGTIGTVGTLWDTPPVKAAVAGTNAFFTALDGFPCGAITTKLPFRLTWDDGGSSDDAMLQAVAPSGLRPSHSSNPNSSVHPLTRNCWCAIPGVSKQRVDHLAKTHLLLVAEAPDRWSSWLQMYAHVCMEQLKHLPS